MSVPRCRDVSRQIGTLANRVSRRLKNYAPAGTLETIVNSSVPVCRTYIEGKSGTLGFFDAQKTKKAVRTRKESGNDELLPWSP